MKSHGFEAAACPNTVIATVDSQAVEYHTVRLLGHGASGAVYELQDAHTSATVAAKVIPKAQLQQLNEQQQRLQQQLSVGQLLQHKHIIRLLGCCEDSSNIYVLMEPCTGVSLEDLLQQHGCFSEQQAATVLSQVLPAVAYLHQHGVAHSDLQLKCLLLHSSGCIKLCGFGSAAVVPEGGQPYTNVWDIGVMLHTMLLGQPPAGHMSSQGTHLAASGSAAVQLRFPQQPVLSDEATELLAALLRPNSQQRPGLAEISCHPFMLHWLGKPCSLDSSGPALSDDNTPAAAAVDSCLALDTPSSSCTAGSAALEQYIEQLQQQVLLPAATAAAVGVAAGSAAGNSPVVLNASWHLPPECITGGSWDNTDSCSSSVSGDGVADLTQHTSLDPMSSSPQLTPESSPLPEQLLLLQQKDAGSRLGDQYPAGQLQQQQHAGKCLRIEATNPSFSGWGSELFGRGSSSSGSSSTTQQQQHYGVEKLHQALQQGEEAARATCDSAPHSRQHQQQRLDQLGGQQPHRHQLHAVTAASLAERRSSLDGVDVKVSGSRVSSGSLPDLPSSFSHWGGMGHAKASMQQLQSLAGSHPSDPAGKYESPLSRHDAPADATSSSSSLVAAAAAIRSPAQAPNSSPAGAAAGGAGSGGGVSSKMQRAVPPSPLQVPKSPRPHNMHVPAVSATAAHAPAAAESSSSMPAPTPPLPGSGGSFAACASPKVAMLFRQMAGASGSGGSSGSGAAGAAALASPAVSPPVPMAARMHSHNLGSTGKDITSPMQPVHAQMPRSPAAAGLLNKPVCRDISDRLQACTDAQQPAAAAPSWQDNWQQQQQQQREHAAGAAAAGSSQVFRHRLPADSDPDDNLQQQQQQPVHSRSAPLPRGMHTAGAISPAPPPVAPSPQQQQAAELRAFGRRSCSSIPASPGSQMMADGWRPTPRHYSAAATAAAAAAAAAQNSSLDSSPGAAALCVSIDVMSAVPPGLDAATSYQGPGSPSVQDMLKPMPDLASYTTNGGLLDLPSFNGGRSSSSSSEQPNSYLAELVNSSIGSGNQLPAMPTRGKPGSFGMHTHHQQQQGMTSLGTVGLLQLSRQAGLSDHGLSNLGSGRTSEQLLARQGRFSDHGVSSVAGSSSSNLGRLSDQGTGALGMRDGPSFAEQQGAANLKALAQHVLPSKQQQHAAQRPPLHHAHSHDYPHTPKGSVSAQLAIQWGTSSCRQQLDQQQQRHGVHGKSLRRSLSEDQQQLTQRTQQQQHPVPPREQQPLCRSPSVSMRPIAAVVPAFLSGQLQPHICSPVPEQQQQQTQLSAANSGDCRLLLLGGGSDSQSVSSRGGTPAGTPLSSTGRYLSSLGPPSGGAAAAALGGGPSGASSGGGVDGSDLQNLPLPAFAQFINMGLGTPPVSAPAAAAPSSSSCSPMDLVSAAVAAASPPHSSQQHSTQQQQQQQHSQPSSPSFQQIRRSISTPVAGGSSHMPRSVSGSGAAAAAAGQGHSFTPHPPTSALGGMLSPRAGLQLPAAQGSAGTGVQPCPPPSSQPPAPSPSVKARVTHGNFTLSHMPHVAQQYLLHQQHTGQLPDAYGAAGVSSSGSSAQSAAALAPRRRFSASAADVSHHAPGSRGGDAGASSGYGGSSSAGHTEQRSRSAIADAKTWVGGLLTMPDVDDEAHCELQLEASSKYAADTGEEESCSTPNMDWPAEAVSVELLQEQAEQQQQGLDLVQRDAHASGQQRPATSRQCASAAAGAFDQTSAGTSAGSSSSSKRAGPQQGSPHRRAPAAAAPAAASGVADQDASSGAAAAAGHLQGCPGWSSPVVAAFAHCKGRLGYVMSSGVVGVVFEDSTHIFVRSSDGWACYHEHGDSSSTAAGVGAGLLVVLESGSPGAAAAAAGSKSSSILDSHAQQQHRRTSDTGRNDPSSLKDQDIPVGSSPVAAAAAAIVEAAGSPLAASAAASTFLLPGCTSPGPAAADGSSTAAAAAAGVPEHLAGKARCLRRFVGCLLHQRPYSSSCQPDIMRLPFPVAGKGPAVPAAAAAQQAGCGSVHAGVPHLRSFVHREGCLHLKISDGCHQFIFTGDNSVLLLDAHCSQLAYITHSKTRRSGRHQAAAGADTAAVAAAATGMAHVQVLALGRGAAAAAPPADARLLARVAYASKLVRALQLPASWLEAASSSASVSAVMH